MAQQEQCTHSLSYLFIPKKSMCSSHQPQIADKQGGSVSTIHHLLKLLFVLKKYFSCPSLQPQNADQTRRFSQYNSPPVYKLSCMLGLPHWVLDRELKIQSTVLTAFKMFKVLNQYSMPEPRLEISCSRLMGWSIIPNNSQQSLTIFNHS
jgi:hypothetical protein